MNFLQAVVHVVPEVLTIILLYLKDSSFEELLERRVVDLRKEISRKSTIKIYKDIWETQKYTTIRNKVFTSYLFVFVSWLIILQRGHVFLIEVAVVGGLVLFLVLFKTVWSISLSNIEFKIQRAKRQLALFYLFSMSIKVYILGLNIV